MTKRTGLSLALFLFTMSLNAWGVDIAKSIPTIMNMKDPVSKLAAKIEVDRIEIGGVTLFPAQEIQDALEIAPGDHLERLKLVHTVENLEALYKIHGYEQASVKVQITRVPVQGNQVENVLEFEVVEGKPTRIATIQFVPENIRDEAFRRYWLKLAKGLTEKLGLSVRDVFDQEKISAAKRSLQDLLATEEFIGAKVDDIRVNSSEPPMGPKMPQVARWVAVEVHIDLGDRVSFGFQGNEVFTEGELNGFVDEQRTYGLGRDYIGAIQGRIEQEYHAIGYPDVKVTTRTFERPKEQERHVTFMIDEGSKVIIDEVNFDGNQNFSDDQLRKHFYENASALVNSGYYVEKDVDRAATLLIDWMKSKGFLSAKLVTISPTVVDKQTGFRKARKAKIVIYVYEGEQTLVHDISLAGLKELPEEDVLKILGLKAGAPLNLFAFSEGIEALKAAYRARGYLDFRVSNENTEQVVKYSQENRVADVHLDLAEGVQYRVSAVQVEGLSFTKDKVARREVKFQEGDVVEEPKLIDAEARLRKLGIFASVAVRAIDDPNRPGYKVILVTLQEGTPGVIAGGPGFRNDLGIRAFGELAYTDLWGLNQTLDLSVNANRRFVNYQFGEYQAQLSYSWPWFVIDELTFRPSLSATQTQYYSFNSKDKVISLTWQKVLNRKPKVTALLTYSLEHIDETNVLIDPTTGLTGDQSVTIGTLTPALIFDTRDDELSPSSGVFISSSFELAHPDLLSQTNPYPVGYTRFQFRSDFFLPLGKKSTWYFSFRTGFERSLEQHNPAICSSGDTGCINFDGAIPFSKQYALGGVGSLRGYGEQELNYENRYVYGILSYVNYRTQLDVPFIGGCRFGPFLDVANLQIDSYSLTNNLIFGAGIGFHYQTPVGPVNLDWGFPLNQISTLFSSPTPNPPQDSYHFYFSIGII